MKNFEYFIPTELIFGEGSLDQLGEKAKEIGKKALLVTTPESDVFKELYAKTKRLLKEHEIEVTHFDEVIPNPTRAVVNQGVELAKNAEVDFIIGLGGGSSMDVAKAVAVGVTHEGEAWDYLHYKEQPSDKTLPIVAISTTAGTGSQVTQCSVMTNEEDDDKSAIWNPNIYPKLAIVDPSLVLTLPKTMTAMTGFDALAHNFEGYISTGSSAYTDILALEGIKLVVETLPELLDNLSDIDLRSKMSWADTLGGYVITHAGVTLPHGLGMQISGHIPHISHGLSLAITYPEFTRYTYKHSVQKFATVARIFNPALEEVNDETAAEKCCEEFDQFLKKIGLWTNFKELGVELDKLREIADSGQVLDDYKNNPRVATIDEMYDILVASYERGV